MKPQPDLAIEGDAPINVLTALVRLARWLQRANRNPLALNSVKTALEAWDPLPLEGYDAIAEVVDILADLEELSELQKLHARLEKRHALKQSVAKPRERMVSALLQLSAVDAALELIGIFQQDWMRANGIVRVLEYALQKGDMRLILERSDQLLDLARGIQANPPRQYTGMLAFILSAERWKWWAIKKINLALIQAGDAQYARSILEKTCQDLPPSTEPERSRRLYAVCYLAQPLAALGRRDEALTLLRACLASAIQEQDDVDGWGDHEFTALAEAFMELNDLQAAKEAVYHIVHRHRSYAARLWLIRQLAEKGHTEDALKQARTEWESQMRHDALAAIIEAIAEKTQFTTALELLPEIQEPYTLAKTVEKISLHLPGNQPPDKAIQFLKRLQDAVMGISVLQPGDAPRSGVPTAHTRTPALRAIARAMAKTGEVDLAIHAARMASPDWHQANALLDVAQELSIQKKEVQAIALVREAEALARKDHAQSRCHPDPAEEPALLAVLALRCLEH